MWTRQDSGFYIGTLEGAFPIGRTFTNGNFYPGNIPDDYGWGEIQLWVLPDQIAVATITVINGLVDDYIDDMLYYGPVEILVYPET